MNTELLLTLIALLCAAVTPNAFVVGGLGLVPMSLVSTYALLPALIVQVAILLYARGSGYPRLFNRLVTGLWVGAIATTGLDVVRQPGTFFGYLAHDEARMAGEMILATSPMHEGEDKHGTSDRHTRSGPESPGGAPSTGEARPAHERPRSEPRAPGAGGAEREKHAEREAATPQPAPKAEHTQPLHGGEHHVTAADFVGYAYHYWNGASFAVIYALLFGRTAWWGPLLYSIFFIDTGMMLFMQAAMGPLTWGIIVVAFLAHVAFGLVVGVLLQRFLRDDGTILALLFPSKLLQRA